MFNGPINRYKPAFVHEHNQRRRALPIQTPAPAAEPPGRVPRLTKLMALALRLEHLLRSGAVDDQTELAELGHVTRARVTQIMNLLHLAPDIQEDILFLPPVVRGQAPIGERDVRPIVRHADWSIQRGMWRLLRAGAMSRSRSVIR